MRVAALIPAFNEAESIVETLTAAAQLQPIDEIVVIDDGSTDDTYALASSCSLPKVSVLRLPSNRGKGGALNFGRREVHADVYLLLDADLGSSAALADKLLEPVLRGEADMTIARFGAEQSKSGAKMGFGLVRRTASLGIKILTGSTVLSPLSGQRAVTAKVLDAVGEFAAGFGVEVALTVGALHHGFKIVEIPLNMKHRAFGRGLKGLRHRGGQFFAVLRALWDCWKKGWH